MPYQLNSERNELKIYFEDMENYDISVELNQCILAIKKLDANRIIYIQLDKLFLELTTNDDFMFTVVCEILCTLEEYGKNRILITWMVNGEREQTFREEMQELFEDSPIEFVINSN